MRGGSGTGTCNDSQDEHEGNVDVGDSQGGRRRQDLLIGCEQGTAERSGACVSEGSDAEGSLASGCEQDYDEWDDDVRRARG